MEDSTPQDDIPSKTRRKQAMHALQALGAELVELPKSRTDEIGLPEALNRALADARRFTAHEARRRQIQYIGRLMRDIDPEPIRTALERFHGKSRAEAARLKMLERWRSRLIEDDAALTEYAAEHAHADIQALRTLIRNARREIAAARPPRAQRELYRVLRETAPREAPTGAIKEDAHEQQP
jgi:ribosome-associated protein